MGSIFSSPPKVKAPKMDIAKDIQSYVSGMSSSLPQMLQQEQQFRPQFQGLNLNDIQSFLSGTQGQQGLFGLSRTAAQEAGMGLGQAREAELQQMTGQTSLSRGLLQSLSPEQVTQLQNMQNIASQSASAEGDYSSRMGQALQTFGIQPEQFNPNISQQGVSPTITQRGILGSTLTQGGPISPTIRAAEQSSAMADRIAQEAFDRRGSLSPQEQRLAQQSARESFAAAGRLGGNAAIAAEIMNREQALAGRRAEAAAADSQAFQQRQNLAGLRSQEQQALFGQQLGSRQLQTAEEQALFNQQMVAREQALQQEQALFGQDATNAQLRMAQQQGLFGQQLSGSQQTAAMQQAGLSQLLGIEQMRAGLRGTAGEDAARAFSAAGQFYSQPGLQLLSASPLSFQQGQSFVQSGLGAIGAGTPQLFDPAVGLNLGAAQRSNQVAASSANAQAQAAHKAAMMNMIGSVAQGAGTAAASDRRLKTDIKKVGKTDSGLSVYTYKYKGDNKTHMGVMAQEVEEVFPEAVTEIDGYKAVYYDLIK